MSVIVPLTLTTKWPMRPNATFLFAFWLKKADNTPQSLTGYKATARLTPVDKPQQALDFNMQNGRVKIVNDGTKDWFYFILPPTETSRQTWTTADFNVLIKEPTTGYVQEYINFQIELLPAGAETPV